jgi:hypothetical protein
LGEGTARQRRGQRSPRAPRARPRAREEGGRVSRGGVLSAGAALSHGEDVSDARPSRDRWQTNERPGWRARETGPGRRAICVDACRVGASARGHALFMSSRSRFAAGADPGEPPSAVRRAARGSSGSRRPAGTPGRRIASGPPRLGSPARPPPNLDFGPDCSVCARPRTEPRVRNEAGAAVSARGRVRAFG